MDVKPCSAVEERVSEPLILRPVHEEGSIGVVQLVCGVNRVGRYGEQHDDGRGEGPQNREWQPIRAKNAGNAVPGVRLGALDGCCCGGAACERRGARAIGGGAVHDSTVSQGHAGLTKVAAVKRLPKRVGAHAGRGWMNLETRQKRLVASSGQSKSRLTI